MYPAECLNKAILPDFCLDKRCFIYLPANFDDVVHNLAQLLLLY